MIYIKLKELATEQGLTIGEVAERSHVRASYVLALWKNPTNTDVKLNIIDKLAKGLNVPAQELIESVV